jgi:predicted nucleic acid-binding protein
MSKTNSDFNDLMLIELCKKNMFALVTHDIDFKDSDIHVLTANNELLGTG